MLNPSIISGFIAELEVRKITHSRHNLRANLGLLDDLMSSISEKGLLQPIVVRPAEEGFEVIAGNRRLEACKRLGLRKITCHMLELDDKEAYEASLIENIQHNALDPIEEAESFKKYVEEFGYGSISELARKIHRSQTYVTRRIQLLDVAPEVRNLVSLGQMSPSIAQEIARLGDQDKWPIAETIANNNLRRNHVREIVSRIKEVERVGDQSNTQKLLTLEVKKQRLERIIDKCITSLKMSMSRVSDLLDDIGDDFVLREVIFNWRQELSQQIDTLVKLRRKLKTLSNRTLDEVS